MNLFTLLDSLVIGALSTWLIVLFRRRSAYNAHLPPGPRRFPIIGSAMAMPRSYPSRGFAKLGEVSGWTVSRIFPLTHNLCFLPQQYGTFPPLITPEYGLTGKRCTGDMMYLKIFNQGLLVLNSQEAAFQVLNGHGESSSGRPFLIMAGTLYPNSSHRIKNLR